MEGTELHQTLNEINQGNDLARERLIRHYRPYIINTVGHICKRYVSWSDEETSIALLSLNRAIDTYDSAKGRTFRNYVYLLIQRDLIDYYRREKREKHLSLHFSSDEEDMSVNQLEFGPSIQSYQRSVESADLVDEILELNRHLADFHISFEELEFHSPKHKKTRQKCLRIATTFVQDTVLVKNFLRKKHFPVSLFTKKTGYRRKTIERHRKFLVTLIILKLHPEWTHLSEFIKVSPEMRDNHDQQNN